MHPIRHIALPIFLGVLTTVGSALALAAWMPMDMYPRQRGYSFIANEHPWNGFERSTFAMRNIWWSRIDAEYLFPPPPPGETIRGSMFTLSGRTPAPDPTHPQTSEEWLELYREQRDSEQSSDRIHLDHAPPWGTFADGRAPPVNVRRGTDHAFGWPRPVLWYSVYGSTSTILTATGPARAAHADQLVGGHLLTHVTTLGIRSYNFRALPYRIHWPGLLINTALFAILWFTLLFAPGTLRRAIRRKRGRCTTCGYDLRGLPNTPCPECGAATSARLHLTPAPQST